MGGEWPVYMLGDQFAHCAIEWINRLLGSKIDMAVESHVSKSAKVGHLGLYLDSAKYCIYTDDGTVAGDVNNLGRLRPGRHRLGFNLSFQFRRAL